jgi:hypothetical protein
MLLQKITALRQRLEQAQGLANEARAAAALLTADDEPAGPRLAVPGVEHDQALDAVVRAATGVAQPDRTPGRLTARAHRVLGRGREMLDRLRTLADAFGTGHTPEDAPLGPLYRDTVAMIDTALRTVALLPDSAAAQMHLCRGLEVTLEEVADRLRTLTAGEARLRRQDEQVQGLAQLLVGLADGQRVGVPHLGALADQVLAEARECEPLRFLEADPLAVPHFVASHSLTVARVTARVVRHDPDLRPAAHQAVLAALVQDVGMLAVPAAVLAHPGVLDADQRRLVEAHCQAGRRAVSAAFPESPALAEAVAAHHERQDGTGYPEGLKAQQVPALARLLAVCDVYAAFCTSRPHRPARATRTALADALLLAEQGQLDHHFAECLLALSFYPVGSVVELAHGAVGVVVAAPAVPGDLNSPARPVVALLTDAQGEPLSRPHHIDLAQTDSHSIVRLLPPAERAELLARRFPHWAA